MGLFDKTATATPGKNIEDISTSGMGSLLPELFQKAITEGTINPNNTSPQDFQSFVVTNPDIVDPGIDISGLKTTTDANIVKDWSREGLSTHTIDDMDLFLEAMRS